MGDSAKLAFLANNSALLALNDPDREHGARVHDEGAACKYAAVTLALRERLG
jgi:hypothetical protein